MDFRNAVGKSSYPEALTELGWDLPSGSSFEARADSFKENIDINLEWPKRFPKPFAQKNHLEI